MASQVYSGGLWEAALLGGLGIEVVLAQGLPSEEPLRLQVSECSGILYSRKPVSCSQCFGSTQRKGVRALHGTHTGLRGQPSGVGSSLLLWIPGTELRSSSLNYKCLYSLNHLARQHLPFSHGFYSSHPGPLAHTRNTTAVPSPQVQ